VLLDESHWRPKLQVLPDYLVGVSLCFKEFRIGVYIACEREYPCEVASPGLLFLEISKDVPVIFNQQIRPLLYLPELRVI
jgi:hypothetical protein